MKRYHCSCQTGLQCFSSNKSCHVFLTSVGSSWPKLVCVSLSVRWAEWFVECITFVSGQADVLCCVLVMLAELISWSKQNDNDSSVVLCWMNVLNASIICVVIYKSLLSCLLTEALSIFQIVKCDLLRVSFGPLRCREVHFILD